MNAILTAHAEVSMVTAHVESDPVAFIEEVLPMLQDHYKELSVHRQHGFALHPDFAAYRAKATMGELLAVSLRQDGELVGYFFGFIGPALHYVDCLTLSMDIMYVAKGARGSKGRQHGATLLFETMEAEARRRGVRQIRLGSKIHRGRHTEAFYRARGYVAEEIYWSRWAEVQS